MELGRILLFCKYVASRLKYSSACYSSSKLQWSGGILRCLNEMDCMLPPVSCGERPIIDGAGTSVAYSSYSYGGVWALP